MPILINGVDMNCINQAAVCNHIPATILLSILKKESGRNGQAIRNKNGTVDLGVFQINEVWLSQLASYGYTRSDLQYHACKNVMAAGWILARNLASNIPAWQGIGNYHSKTILLNQRYAIAVYKDYKEILHTLHFNSHQ